MSLNLERMTYREAVQALVDAGYTHLASGDWSLVFQIPDADRVVRITPYDPAHLIFAELCVQFPHPNLPQILSIKRLQRNCFLVEMPRYASEEIERQQAFLDRLKSTMANRNAADSELADLCSILEIGIQRTDRLPYSDGIDWNPENVLSDGSNPKFVDAFSSGGTHITARLEKGEPVELDEEAVADFLSIPFHSPYP